MVKVSEMAAVLQDLKTKRQTKYMIIFFFFLAVSRNNFFVTLKTTNGMAILRNASSPALERYLEWISYIPGTAGTFIIKLR